MVATLITVSVLAVMAGAALTVNTANKNEIESSRSRMRSIYLAEAGVAEALATLYASGINGEEIPATYGSSDNPRQLEAGRYWSELINNGDGTYTARSTGSVNGSERALEVIVEVEEETIYDHAIFAGNSSGDPNYTLKLGGTGNQADYLVGDVFSGGDIAVSGDASVTGTLRASGAISGSGGETNISLPIPDISGMDYSVNHDVDVAAAFASGDAAWKKDDAGGSAWQLPEDHPAHIFRKDASDRTGILDNGKPNYYLEDPYEPVRVDSKYDGSDAYPITLTGTSDNPGKDTSSAVFYIDGNLWVHNGITYSFKFVHDNDESVNCTFVVKGNIYFSDNVFYDDPETDGIAFIAMKDDKIDDSGNIYFGDPQFGTIEYMDGYMYAENNFIDVNLDASGSKKVTINGNMTAGNHVAIDRDYKGNHSKLTVIFDDRVKTGAISLPSLPTTDLGEPEATAYTVVSWREVSVDHWINGGYTGDGTERKEASSGEQEEEKDAGESDEAKSGQSGSGDGASDSKTDGSGADQGSDGGTTTDTGGTSTKKKRRKGRKG